MKTRIQPGRRQSGIMLAEMIVYIAVFSLLVTLGTLSYNRFEEQSRRLRGAAEDIARAVDAGERWREDVRKATARLEYNRETRELRIPQQSSEVIYRFSDGQIERKAANEFVPLLKNVKVSSMGAIPRQHVTSWRWEIELKTRARNARLQPLFQFEAVAPNQS